jgi:5-methylcytosine-specific restriction endonuclease McrA
LGGKETDENRQALCKGCHALKSEREAKERGGIESL